VRATRAIVNHASIGKYQLRFFLWEEFKCHAKLILLKLGVIFFLIVKDITSIGIQKEIL